MPESGFIEVPGGRLHHEAIGSGDPVLLQRRYRAAISALEMGVSATSAPG